MFAIGWKELLCVALFTALVWAAHSILRLAFPLDKSETHLRVTANLRRDVLRALAVFAVSWLPAFFLARPLLAAASELQRSLPDALPLVSISPGDADIAARLDVPFLLAIFLSSPAWITLVLRLVDPESPRSPILPLVAFSLGGVFGYAVLPAAIPVLDFTPFHRLSPFISIRGLSAMLWDATIGTGLLLLTAPVVYRAATARLTHLDRPVRRWWFLTPLLMSIAAIATADAGVFRMTLVFLPMCVSAMAGIGVAEVVSAHSTGRPLSFARIGTWGLRLAAECLLAALIAAVFVML